MNRRLTRGELLRSLPPESLPLLQAVLGAAVEAGAVIYLVGGPVRDWLLGREIRDVDLLVQLDSDGAVSGASRVAEAAASTGTKLTSHGRFGTVRLSDGAVHVDLATMRKEHYAHAGALPSVEPGTLEEDLRRRDFTVNALAIPLAGSGEDVRLELVDHVSGIADLRAGRLRILHARSFHDDPTRVLRAARLAPRLGFALSRDSRSALRSALRDGAFGQVSGDRLRRELERCFSDAALGLDPASALRLLQDWHVLSILEPGLALPRESVTALRRLGRTIASPPWRGPRLRPWVAGLSIWLAPLPPALRRRALRRFSVRGEIARRIDGFARLRDERLAALAGVRGRGAVDAILGGTDEEELYALHASAEPAIRRRILRWAAEDRSRRAPVTGDDLVALGLAGPAVGRAIARIREAYLDGEVANREEAVALAEELARSRRARLAGPGPKRATARRATRPRKGAKRGAGGAKKRAPARRRKAGAGARKAADSDRSAGKSSTPSVTKATRRGKSTRRKPFSEDG